jgi:hypothetical protein
MRLSALVCLGFAVTLGFGFAGAACDDAAGSGGSSSTGTTASTASGATCSLGGSKCADGCIANVGCAQCLMDTECTDPAKPACVAGKCEECSASAPCGVANACFPKDHKCHPKCAKSADCPGDSPICDAASGTCLGCQTPADCPAGSPVCESTRAQCSACGSNADCGAVDPACDFSDGKCHQCLIDSECKNGQVCAPDRKCHDSCLTKCTDPGKPFCQADTQSCVECLLNADCGVAKPICSTSGSCVAG